MQRGTAGIKRKKQAIHQVCNVNRGTDWSKPASIFKYARA